MQSSCHCMCQSVFTCGSRLTMFFSCMSLQSARVRTRAHVTPCAGLIPLRSALVMSRRWSAAQRLGGRSEASGKTSALCWRTTTNCAGAPSRQAWDWAQRSPNRIRAPISFAAIMLISQDKTWMHLVEKPETWKTDCMKTVAQANDFWKNKKCKTLIYLLCLISAVGHFYAFLPPSE